MKFLFGAVALLAALAFASGADAVTHRKFDAFDFSNATCITSGTAHYYYAGSRNVTSLNNTCDNWSQVWKLTKNPDQRIGALMDHNFCRTVSTPENRTLPWCYVNGKPEDCFEICPDNAIFTTDEKVKEVVVKTNLPFKRIAQIILNDDQLFTGFDWGNDAYYNWKESKAKHKAEIDRQRRLILFIVTGVFGLVAVLYFITYLVGKLEKKRKAGMNVEESDDDEEEDEPESQNPNNESSSKK